VLGWVYDFQIHILVGFICHLNIGSSGIPFLLLCYLILWNIAKDRKVIPDPIDDRKFQE